MTKKYLKSPYLVFTAILLFFFLNEKMYTRKTDEVTDIKIHQSAVIVDNTPTPIPTATPTPKPRKLDGGKLFNLVNAYRTKNGFNELVWYHPLCEFAKARSEQIKADWSHTGFDKEAAEGRLFTTICPECKTVGENLAKDFYSEEAVIQGWLKSPSHKKNLDDQWDWGCAMYYSNNYASIIFGKKR